MSSQDRPAIEQQRPGALRHAAEMKRLHRSERDGSSVGVNLGDLLRFCHEYLTSYARAGYPTFPALEPGGGGVLKTRIYLFLAVWLSTPGEDGLSPQSNDVYSAYWKVLKIYKDQRDQNGLPFGLLPNKLVGLQAALRENLSINRNRLALFNILASSLPAADHRGLVVEISPAAFVKGMTSLMNRRNDKTKLQTHQSDRETTPSNARRIYVLDTAAAYGLCIAIQVAIVKLRFGPPEDLAKTLPRAPPGPPPGFVVPVAGTVPSGYNTPAFRSPNARYSPSTSSAGPTPVRQFRETLPALAAVTGAIRNRESPEEGEIDQDEFGDADLNKRVRRSSPEDED